LQHFLPLVVVEVLEKALYIFIPLSFAFAILKYRLMEIDVVLEAIPNRATARIKARTLTRGSAAGPVVPHLRQVMIGVWMLRSVRIR